MTRPARSRWTLPLVVWVGALTCGGVLVATWVSAGILAARGLLAPRAVQALGLGTAAGLLVELVAVLLAGQVAAALRALRGTALQRLQAPSAPLAPAAPPVLLRTSTELADLAAVLEALHARVRLGDQVGERHRATAQTAGAGVFELLSGLVTAEEGARGQLAAELHDTVAQSLMIARGLLSAGPTTAADLAKVSDYVEDAEEQVRAVMAGTRPPALREGDLADAVGNFALDLRQRYGLVVEVVWPETAYPLPLASAITVYRFFQEALLNVVKHADVDAAVVELVVDETLVRASVTDRGPGFDPSAVRPDRGRHVGLGLLRERARLSGGGLEVASVVGTGTTLTLFLPRVAPPVGSAIEPAVPARYPPEPAAPAELLLSEG